MTTELKDLEIDEVSFVDIGANKGARVILLKRGETEMPTIEKRVEELTAQISKLKDQSADIQAIQKTLKELDKSDATDSIAKLDDIEQKIQKLLDKEKDDVIADLTKRLEKAEGSIGKSDAFKAFRAKLSPVLQKAFDGMDDDERESFMTKFSKSIDDPEDPVNKALDKVTKENVDLTKKVTKLEHESRLSKIQKDLSDLEGFVKVDEFAEEYLKLLDSDKDAAESMLKRFRALAKQAKEGGLFKILGKDDDPDSSPDGKIDKAVKKYQSEHADENLTKEQAMAKVLEDNPELYDESLEESRSSAAA